MTDSQKADIGRSPAYFTYLLGGGALAFVIGLLVFFIANTQVSSALGADELLVTMGGTSNPDAAAGPATFLGIGIALMVLGSIAALVALVVRGARRT